MSTSATAQRARFACAICGRFQPAERMIYSPATHNHYCRDDKACARRATRRGVTAQVVA